MSDVSLIWTEVQCLRWKRLQFMSKPSESPVSPSAESSCPRYKPDIEVQHSTRQVFLYRPSTLCGKCFSGPVLEVSKWGPRWNFRFTYFGAGSETGPGFVMSLNPQQSDNVVLSQLFDLWSISGSQIYDFKLTHTDTHKKESLRGLSIFMIVSVATGTTFPAAVPFYVTGSENEAELDSSFLQ